MPHRMERRSRVALPHITIPPSGRFPGLTEEEERQDRAEWEARQTERTTEETWIYVFVEKLRLSTILYAKIPAGRTWEERREFIANFCRRQ